MTATLTKARAATIARPLKVLVPLIQTELAAGESAGLEHYREAGVLLLEAKAQMPYGNWDRWLRQNFKAADGSVLSRTTAHRYMRLAQVDTSSAGATTDYTRLTTGRATRTQVSGPARALINQTKALDAELYAKEIASREEVVKLRRRMAAELINLGYRAMAVRLHPDQGGSKDAMVHLKEVRDVLLQIAETRSFT